MIANNWESEIMIWNVQSRKLEYLLRGHTKTGCIAIFSSDDKYIISYGKDSNLIIWSVQDKRQERALRFSGEIKSLTITSDSRHIISDCNAYISIIHAVEKKDPL